MTTSKYNVLVEITFLVFTNDEWIRFKNDIKAGSTFFSRVISTSSTNWRVCPYDQHILIRYDNSRGDVGQVRNYHITNETRRSILAFLKQTGEIA